MASTSAKTMSRCNRQHCDVTGQCARTHTFRPVGYPPVGCRGETCQDISGRTTEAITQLEHAPFVTLHTLTRPHVAGVVGAHLLSMELQRVGMLVTSVTEIQPVRLRPRQAAATARLEQRRATCDGDA